jgi:hypothetical protein
VGSTSIAPASSLAGPPDGEHAHRILYATIGCFTGGAWVEALGATGEERTLATTRRCRILATEALGATADDEATFVAVRAIDPKAVEAVAASVSAETEIAALVRMIGSAAREAYDARRAAETLRKNPTAKLDEVLIVKQSLAQLNAVKTGKHATTARLVALVLAADHIESSRGLPARAKVLTAAPAFEVIFGVARPADPEAWSAYVSAAAKAGGHAPADASEQSAFAGVVTSFAEKFEAMVKDAPIGEPKEAAAGYANRLRNQLAAAAKKQAAK